MDKMTRLEWVLSMIDVRMLSADVTYDVMNDYSKNEQEKIAGFLETVFDFELQDQELETEDGFCYLCKDKPCLREKCTYEHYLNS